MNRFASACPVALFVCATPLLAQSWFEKEALKPSEAQSDVLFGNALDMHGDLAVVSARDATHGGVSEAGAVDVFRRLGTEWVHEERLLPETPVELGHFGVGVAVFGDTIVAGSGPVDTAQGRAEFFQRDPVTGEWGKTQEVMGSQGEEADHFGTQIDLWGDWALIGASREDVGANTEHGVAYVFHRDGGVWTEVQRLSAPAGYNAGRLGISVTLWEERALVGSRSLTPQGAQVGEEGALVFDWDGREWLQSALLQPDDGTASDDFGWGSGLWGDVAVVGARGADAPGNDSGAAYVFERQPDGTWPQVQKLVGSDTAAGDTFGKQVSVWEDRVLLCAPENGGSVGALYVFRRELGVWVEEEEIEAASVATTQLGQRISLHGTRVLAGSPATDVAAGGTAFLFDLGTVAHETDLDPLETVVLDPGNEGGGPLEEALVEITNTTGPPDATVSVSETEEGSLSGAGGFGLFAATLAVETSLDDGSFFMTVSVPFTAADLGGANPLLVDLVYLDLELGLWQLAVAGNVANSPGQSGPVGDRFEEQGAVTPEPGSVSGDLGDYGVFWNPSEQAGFVWAHVDHATDFAVTPSPLFAYGCGLNPPQSLVGVSGSSQLGGVLTLGLDDPLGGSEPGALGVLLLAVAPAANFPCGLSLPGYGMGGGPGELLIGVLPPDPVAVLVGGAWSGPGGPVPIGIPIPNDAALEGLEAYAQGLLAGVSSIKLTSAVRFRVGP